MKTTRIATPLRRSEYDRLTAAGVNTATAEALARARAVCGTAAGYRRHLRAGQAACRPCRAGHARAQAARHAARQAA